MSFLLRKSDVVAFFNGNMAEVGRAFAATTHGKPLTKTAVRLWPDEDEDGQPGLVPELRARQLLETYPDLREFVLDPITRLTPAETRARLAGR